MADVVEVVARLGDSIVAVAHGPRVTVGESGDIYAPAAQRAFALEASSDAILVGEPITTNIGLLTIDIRRVPAATDRIPRERSERRPAGYIGISLLVHLALWGTSIHAFPGKRGTPVQGNVVRVLPSRRSPTAIVSPSVDDDVPPAPNITMVISDKKGNGIGPISEFVGHAGVDMVGDVGSRRERAIAAARASGILEAAALQGEHPLGYIPGAALARGFDDRAVDGSARGESTAQAFGSNRRLHGGCTHEPCGDDSPCRSSTSAYGVGERLHAQTVPLCGTPDGRTRSPCAGIVGDLDQAIIRRYIRRKLPAIIGCYEKYLLADESLTALVDTTFLIDPTGHPRDIDATGMNADVASCVATVLGTIQFPRSSGSTQVHYPFSFIVAGS